MAGTVLKMFQTSFYIITFLCAGIVLGIYAFFLFEQASRNVSIPITQKIVAGMGGVGVLYTIFASLLTCCLGEYSFFAYLAMFFNLLLSAAFIAIAILTRDGASTCEGIVQTPFGNGPADQQATSGSNGFGSNQGQSVTFPTTFGTACKLNTAAYVVAIIGAIVFFASAFVQRKLLRQYQNQKTDEDEFAVKEGEPEAFAAGEEGGERHRRQSAYSDVSTLENSGTYVGNKYESSPSSQSATVVGGSQSGTQSSGVNPYGYDNRRGGGPYIYDNRRNDSRRTDNSYSYDTGRNERSYAYDNRRDDNSYGYGSRTARGNY